MATLYRKYRPQNFEEVVGQNHIKLTLEHEITSGKTAHAYLFCGPRAVGKTTMARVLAKAVNCENRKEGEFEPCDKCSSCQDIIEGKSMDVIEIDAASHTGVDNVRENIIASAKVTPARSKAKVFIIDEVHMLSVSAFNALLKIIEEPPASVIFILCTTEIHKVPTTIISRCQRFDFKKISISDIAKKLRYIVENEDVKVDKDILEAVARQSGGHMRDAESLLGQIVSVSGKEVSRDEAELVMPRSDLAEAISLVDLLSKKDAAGAIRLINKLLDEGVDLKVFTGDLVEILRKMILIKVSPGLADKFGLELGESLEMKINEAGKNAVIGGLTACIEEFLKARGELKNSSIIQLPLELAIVRLCRGADYQENNPDAGANRAGVKTGPVAAGADAAKRGQPAIAPSAIGSVRPARIDGAGGFDAEVTHEDILAKWGEVLAKVKQQNHSLSFVLRVCEPRNLKGSQLCLAFKYKFHKDRMDNAAIRAIVEKVLADVYGASLTIEAVTDENMEIGESALENPAPESATGFQTAATKEEKPDNGGNMLDNLLKTFGGKVVG